jgi:hypothetical protein
MQKAGEHALADQGRIGAVVTTADDDRAAGDVVGLSPGRGGPQERGAGLIGRNALIDQPLRLVDQPVVQAGPLARQRSAQAGPGNAGTPAARGCRRRREEAGKAELKRLEAEQVNVQRRVDRSGLGSIPARRRSPSLCLALTTVHSWPTGVGRNADLNQGGRKCGILDQADTGAGPRVRRSRAGASTGPLSFNRPLNAAEALARNFVLARWRGLGRRRGRPDRAHCEPDRGDASALNQRVYDVDDITADAAGRGVDSADAIVRFQQLIEGRAAVRAFPILHSVGR